MGRKIYFLQKCDFIDDYKKHMKGPFCWCHPEYSEKDNTYYHQLQFDKGSNMMHDREFKA